MHLANRGPEQIPITVTGQDGSAALVFKEMSWWDASCLMDGLSMVRPMTYDPNTPEQCAIYGYKTKMPQTERVWRVDGVRDVTFAENNLTIDLEHADHEQPLRAWAGEKLIVLYETRKINEIRLSSSRSQIEATLASSLQSS